MFWQTANKLDAVQTSTANKLDAVHTSTAKSHRDESDTPNPAVLKKLSLLFRSFLSVLDSKVLLT